MNRWWIVLVLSAFVTGYPLGLRADEDVNSEERKLLILDGSEEVARLDPAFEQIMDKLDSDFHYVLSSPFRLTPKGTAVVGVTLLTTLFLLDMDEQYLDDFSSKTGDRSDYMYDRFQMLGKHIPEITAGVYLLGYFLNDSTLKSNSLQGLESSAIAVLFTAASAFVLGRESPVDGGSSSNFEPFVDPSSMPDMRTSLAFSVASVFAYEKGVVPSLFYYGLATGVGLSRLYDEESWPSDVFLGAVLGTAIGRTVSYLSRVYPERKASIRPVLFSSYLPAVGVELTYCF